MLFNVEIKIVYYFSICNFYICARVSYVRAFLYICFWLYGFFFTLKTAYL